MAARCIFCDQCGMLLPEPTVAGVSVDCKLCGTMASASVFEALVLTSSTVERTVEPDVADVDSLHQKQQQSQPVRAVVNEPCPKCKHPELQYYTMQLRSADEGQTVFYECAKCGHAFSTNT